MKKLRVDFRKRDERDRIPIPGGTTIEKGELVIVYDDDMAVFAARSQTPGMLDIDWSSVRMTGWKQSPPDEVRKEYEENPRSAWKHWPED